MTPHLNHPNETVEMGGGGGGGGGVCVWGGGEGHNLSFYAELTKIIPNYQPILPSIYSSAIKYSRKYICNWAPTCTGSLSALV